VEFNDVLSSSEDSNSRLQLYLKIGTQVISGLNIDNKVICIIPFSFDVYSDNTQNSRRLQGTNTPRTNAVPQPLTGALFPIEISADGNDNYIDSGFIFISAESRPYEIYEVLNLPPPVIYFVASLTPPILAGISDKIELIGENFLYTSKCVLGYEGEGLGPTLLKTQYISSSNVSYK
jgi:hypothetical protein